MPGLSRRLFLKRGSLTVAAAGFLAAVPGLPSLASTLEADAPADSAATSEVASTGGAEINSAGNLSQPLIAHVKDLSTGEISVFSGESEYTFQDQQMAAKLLRATR